MIIVNIIIQCPWRKFENKEDIKSWITKNYLPDEGPDIDKFREYNFNIAKKHGNEYFSMTFIKPNTIVLTQKYYDWTEYNNMLMIRKKTLDFLIENGFLIQVSEPLETFYDKI